MEENNIEGIENSLLKKDSEKVVKIEKSSVQNEFFYTVSQRPPLQMIVFLAFQHGLLTLSGSLAVSSFAAEAVCAGDDNYMRARLLSSTLFMNGITTLFMVTLGIRLPLYQGATVIYIVPLLALQTVDVNRCTNNMVSHFNVTQYNMTLSNETLDTNREFIYTKIRELSGCLMLAGFVHFAIGALGLVGIAMRFIGPVTVVPNVMLTGIYLCRATTKFSKPHWGISLSTAAVAIILSIYMRKIKLPLPYWTRRKGFHITRYPLQQVYAILIAILFGWMLAGILTNVGALTDDPSNIQYKARTDSRTSAIKTSRWFYVPYPGQFGKPTFNAGVFSVFLIATLVSILDSIGDYYACARMCRVPPPPRHGVNRGIAIEGLCTAISGAVGCGHATSTIGGSIGGIGVTRVASRAVFLGLAVVYILFGILGKFSAVFIAMPYPVLGGGMVIMYGMFTGVNLSNLSDLSLSSTRNLAVIGISILMGLMIPYWIETTPDIVLTGDFAADNTLKMVLAVPNITGGLVACFLDNTAPGTLDERGIKAWQLKELPYDFSAKYCEGLEVYDPWLPSAWFSYKIMKYIPFLPYREKTATPI